MFTRRGFVVSRLIDIFVGLALVLLLLRVLFRLFHANPGAAFVNWIYDTSDVLIAPFRGIFPSATIEPGYTLDITALFAMLMYAVLGFVLAALLDMLVRPEPEVVERPARRRR